MSAISPVDDLRSDALEMEMRENTCSSFVHKGVREDAPKCMLHRPSTFLQGDEAVVMCNR